MFVNDKKQGKWIEKKYFTGLYKNDKKEGEWIEYKSDSVIMFKLNYKNGKLHGKSIYYNDSGNIVSERIYENGEIISKNIDSTFYRKEELPRFPGCEEMELDQNELKECSLRKLYEYIGIHINYPPKSRTRNIQGKALVYFQVDKDGNIVNIKVLNGISKDIKKECLRVVKNMPRWTPGKVDGEPVKVGLNLPIFVASACMDMTYIRLKS